MSFRITGLTDPNRIQYWQQFFTDHLHSMDDPFVQKDEVLLQKYSGIRKYTKYYDRTINYGLRNNKLSGVSYEILSQIYGALNESAPITQEMLFLRGVQPTDQFPVDQYQIGTIISDPGISSKSLSYEVIGVFAAPPCCILILRYPPGTKHLSLEPISQYEGELESISYPGEQFRVSEVFETTHAVGNMDLTYRTLVVDYIGNMYTTPQQITQKVDPRIDQAYPLFSNCINQYVNFTQPPGQYDGLYFEDTEDGIVIIMYTGPEYFRAPDIDPNTIRYVIVNREDVTGPPTTLEQISDRIYSLYAVGVGRNIYALSGAATLRRLSYSQEGNNEVTGNLSEIIRGQYQPTSFNFSRTKITCTEPIWQSIFA